MHILALALTVPVAIVGILVAVVAVVLMLAAILEMATAGRAGSASAWATAVCGGACAAEGTRRKRSNTGTDRLRRARYCK